MTTPLFLLRCVQLGIHIGDVVIENVAGTGINVVATKAVL